MTIAKFTHVSEERWRQDAPTGADCMGIAEIPIPVRATPGSAGYDFVTPFKAVIPPGGSLIIPTGIRAEMQQGWVLMIFPRSSLGFRYGARLCNTVGIIDSDYAQADNEGHILIKMRNDSGKALVLEKGERFCQGVFLQYGLAEEAETPKDARTGGLGSTGSQ